MSVDRGNLFTRLSLFYSLPILWALLMLPPAEIRQWFYLDIEQFWSGQYWRFLSGHFMHYSWQHYWLNAAGLLIFQQLFPDYCRHWHWLVSALFILLVVSAGLLLFSEQLNWYVGFSGILTGLYIAAALQGLKRQRLLCIAVLLLVGGYTVLQQFQGELVDGVLFGLSSASRAHLMGMVAGIGWSSLRLGQIWARL